MTAINTRICRLLASAVLLAWPVPAHSQTLVELQETAPSPLPAIAFSDEQGQNHGFTPMQNAFTILHLWATWCTPCVAELPEVDAAQKTYAGNGVRIVAISLDSGMDKVKAFFTQHKIAHLTPYLDVKNATFKTAQARGLPVTLIVNIRGEIIARADGPLDWQRSVAPFMKRQLGVRE